MGQDPRWIMSPQARRRLQRTMTDSELLDLAQEIVSDIEHGGTGATVAVVYATLKREA